ncbi:MAG TPA: hypothetical protein VGA98_05850 [Allosphingosinicella sp.]
MNENHVIPAKAGTSGQEVTAGLHETPAFAGVTGGAGLHKTPAFAGVTARCAGVTAGCARVTVPC